MATLVPATRKQFRLAPFRVTGVSDSTIGFAKRFDFEAYDWDRRPIRTGKRAEVPVCWTIEQGRLTLADFYNTVQEYVDGGEVYADPTPRWGAENSVVRVPKAVIIENVLGGNITPGASALAQLQSELVAAHIFAGVVDTDVTNDSHLLVRMNLLHNDATELVDGAGDLYGVLEVDETQSTGGEVLFILEEPAVSASSITPYFDQNAALALSLVAAHDLDLLERSVPRFARVQYLYLQGGSELITSDAVQALEDFIDSAPAGCIDYRQFPGLIHNSGSLADATDVAVDVIRTFFSL